ncbi:MAG: LTA synthase family protein [Oscillospiraceae bacterium]|nr:LTA synthase family protein [Oscillospiraceae bacterium]
MSHFKDLGSRLSLIRTNHKMLSLFTIVYAFIIPSITTVLPDFFRFGTLGTDFWEYVILRFDSYCYIIPFFLFVFIFLFILSKSLWLPSLFLPSISLLVGIATYNNTFYRGRPLIPADLVLAKDAAIAVKEGFSVVLPKGFYLSVTIIIILFLIALIPKFRKKNYTKSTAILFTFISVLSLFCAYFFFNYLLETVDFTSRYNTKDSNTTIGDTYYKHGFYPSFMAYWFTRIPSAPSSYSEAIMNTLSKEMSTYVVEGEPIDIIVFQIESWQDYSNFDIQPSEDVFANYHALSKEGISGTMVSPKFGGGTANIEYEVLTGFTTGDGITPEMPFNLGLYDGFPSIVNFADSLGYKTISVHSHTPALYNRPNAYRMLGFQESYFSDSFINPEMCGPWISDRECAKKIIELYDKALSEGKPIFIHGLTMQNHLPIGDDRFPTSELITLSSSTLSDPDQFVMRCFCTCLKWTDESLKILTDYFRTVDRKVILLAYGDHQTAIYADETIGDVLRHTDFFNTYNEETDYIKLHGTPYLVWANFANNNAGSTFGNCAPNQLLVNALNAFQVARPTYWNYFANSVTSYSSTTANYIITSEGQILFNKNNTQMEEYEKRQLIQYDLIYGDHYLLNLLY